MAAQWRLIQEQADVWWKALYEVHFWISQAASLFILFCDYTHTSNRCTMQPNYPPQSQIAFACTYSQAFFPHYQFTMPTNKTCNFYSSWHPFEYVFSLAHYIWVQGGWSQSWVWMLIKWSSWFRWHVQWMQLIPRCFSASSVHCVVLVIGVLMSLICSKCEYVLNSGNCLAMNFRPGSIPFGLAVKVIWWIGVTV